MGLTFLRHTTPDVAKGMCYGMTDLSLAGSFAVEVSEILSGLTKIKRVVSSPLQRCATLAKRVAEHHEVEMDIVNGLREMDFGRWEMVPWDDIPREELDEWAANFLDARPHGGESVAQLRERVQSTLQAISDNTLVVTHSGVIRAAAALSDHSEGWNFDIKYGQWVQFSG